MEAHASLKELNSCCGGRLGAGAEGCFTASIPDPHIRSEPSHFFSYSFFAMSDTVNTIDSDHKTRIPSPSTHAAPPTHNGVAEGTSGPCPESSTVSQILKGSASGMNHRLVNMQPLKRSEMQVCPFNSPTMIRNNRYFSHLMLKILVLER